MTTLTTNGARSSEAVYLGPWVPEQEHPSPEPKPEPRPGYEVLDEAHAFLGRFAILPSKAAHDAAVLWATHTHVVNAGNASPRLAVLSELPSSGKTRVLELVGMLSHDPVQEIDPTGPGMVALMSQRQPTALLDEVDTIWGANGGMSNSKLRAVLNAGYKQGATVTRRAGGAYVRDPIYGAVAFGGLGMLPATLMTRSVVIRMQKRQPGQNIDPYYPRVHAPVGTGIGAALGEWARSVALDLASAWPELPEGIEDRAAEIWEPLLAIADAAGGEWSERARAACTELALGNVAEPAEAPGQKVLADIRRIWGDHAVNLPTAEIITRLFSLDGASWSAMWPPQSAPRELAALLAPYGVRPVKVRVGERTAQGYRRVDLAAAWDTVPDVPEH